jgi:Tetratricopeptide repeat
LPRATYVPADPGLPPTVVGRDAALSDLHRLLGEGGGPVVAASAVAGVGRTTLARAYVERHGDGYPAVLWVSGAPEPEQLAALPEGALLVVDDAPAAPEPVPGLRVLATCPRDDLVGERAMRVPAIFDAIAAERESTLGPDHPDTLAARLQLAADRRRRGDLAGAEAQLWQVARTRERVVGPDHADTLAARAQLALLLHARGRLADSAEQLAAVLAGEERTLGADHAQTQLTRARLQANRATRRVMLALRVGAGLLAVGALVWWVA